MRNFNQIKNDDGNSNLAGLGFFWAGYTIGAITLGASMYHTGYQNGETDASHARTVQLENEQLQHALSSQFSPLDRLVLNEENHTYSFDTVVQGKSENCTGKYEAHKDLATAIGPVACTQRITVSQN